MTTRTPRTETETDIMQTSRTKRQTERVKERQELRGMAKQMAKVNKVKKDMGLKRAKDTSKDCIQPYPYVYPTRVTASEYTGYGKDILQWALQEESPEQLFVVLDRLKQQGIRSCFTFPTINWTGFGVFEQFRSREVYHDVMRHVLEYSYEVMYSHPASIAFVLEHAKDIQCMKVDMSSTYGDDYVPSSDHIPVYRRLFEANPGVHALHFMIDWDTSFIAKYAEDIDAITAINEARALVGK